jgi:hypothetical protein
MVIAYTGIPHAQLKQIQPGDVNYSAAHVLVASRRKGQAPSSEPSRSSLMACPPSGP